MSKRFEKEAWAIVVEDVYFFFIIKVIYIYILVWRYELN